MLSAQAQASQTYSYAQCVDAALQQNPMMLESQARIEQASAALAQAKRSRLPSLEAKLIATHTDQPLNAFGLKLSQEQATFADLGLLEYSGPGSANTPPGALNNPDVITNFNTRLEMKIPIYNGGLLSAMRDQAESYRQAALFGDTAVRQMLAFYVLQAFEAIHAARAYVEVASQAEKASRALVKTTNNLVKQGLLVQSEGLSAGVYLAGVQVELAKAKNQVELARDQLRMLMGLPQSEELQVAASIQLLPLTTDRLADGKADKDSELHQLVDQAINNNPQIQAMQAQLEASRAQVHAESSKLKPRFNMMVRNDWNDEDLGQFDASGYTIGGELAWNVFDFGTSKRGVDRVEAQRLQMLAQLNQKKQKVELDVRRAWRLAREAAERVQMRQLAVTQSEQAMKSMDKRYANGLATLTEVLATQAQLDRSRAELVQARYEEKIQLASLYLATGQFGPDKTIQPDVAGDKS